MLDSSWFCLFVGKGNPANITNQVRVALMVEACKMSLDNETGRNMNNHVLKGVITTDGDSYTMGGIAGPVFKTQFDCEEGLFEVNFMIPSRALESAGTAINVFEENKNIGSYVPLPPGIYHPELEKFLSDDSKNS